MASTSRSSSRTASGRASPVARQRSAPRSYSTQSRPKPKRAPAASTALRASATTSGPIPSPGMTAMLWTLFGNSGLRAEDAAEGGPALGLLGRRFGGAPGRRGRVGLHVDAEDPGQGGVRLLRVL